MIIPGDYSGEVTPVPIPNTAVKLFCADGTAFRGRVGRCQVFFLPVFSIFNFSYRIFLVL